MPVQWLVEHTQPFAEAYVALSERRGKTILHENICVARVSDLTLKVVIEKALGSNLVSLKNDFIAFPYGSLDDRALAVARYLRIRLQCFLESLAASLTGCVSKAPVRVCDRMHSPSVQP